MLTAEELAREAAHFGVADMQVRRDHAISHVLAALAQSVGEDVMFFGGTALNRTYLNARLSEDIDLIAHADRTTVLDKG